MCCSAITLRLMRLQLRQKPRNGKLSYTSPAIRQRFDSTLYGFSGRNCNSTCEACCLGSCPTAALAQQWASSCTHGTQLPERPAWELHSTKPHYGNNILINDCVCWWYAIANLISNHRTQTVLINKALEDLCELVILSRRLDLQQCKQ